MTTFVLRVPAVWAGLEAIWERRTSFRRRTRAPGDSPKGARERREFIQEMMNRNPDAFAGELDVQNMMQMFPDKF